MEVIYLSGPELSFHFSPLHLSANSPLKETFGPPQAAPLSRTRPSD